MLEQLCRDYLTQLCVTIPERPVGSDGNQRATAFFAAEMARFGWQVQQDSFPAIGWAEEGATLKVAGQDFAARPSPYSLSCQVTAELVAAASVAELATLTCAGKLLLLHGEIAAEQIMPKNFVFYNPAEHQQLIALLEAKSPAALICATGRNAALAGGLYPFPLFEDGDFDIASVYMTDVEGERLLAQVGQTANLTSRCQRIPGEGWNVIGRKGPADGRRIVITAHIDAKECTPGAIDNGTGVIILLLLAQLLADYDGPHQLEIVAFNGEDYYAAPGQMLYLGQNEGHFGNILYNINIDGAGYKEGPSAFSFYDLPPAIENGIRQEMAASPGIVAGNQWYQGDHSIFLQQGCPALAVSSLWFTDNIADQAITHTPADRPEIVDLHKLVEIADCLTRIIQL